MQAIKLMHAILRLRPAKSRLAIFIFFGFLLASEVANAATYVLPGDFGSGPFSNCSLASGSTYNCSSDITIAINDVVTSSSSSYTLNVSGTVNFSNNVIFGNSSYSINIIAVGSINIANNVVIWGDLMSKNQTITTSNNAEVHGNIAANTIDMSSNATVTGNCASTSCNGSCSGTVPQSPKNCASSDTKPLVVTLAASNITSTGAMLNGTVVPNLMSATVGFNYGSTASYGTPLTAVPSTLPASAISSPVSYALSGLTCNQPYHFQITANNSAGTANGGDIVFTTAACVSAPSSFKASEPTTGSIYTKLAGTAFDLQVVAISGGSQMTSFGNNVTVELLANTGTPSSGYGADNCPTSTVVVQSIASTKITGGSSAVSFAAVANAYRDVRVRISYPTTSPTVISCSTDSFAIRPTSFAITSTNATNTAKTGTPVIKAGASFNLTATAVAGYAGTPLIDNTKVVGSTTAGTLGGSFAATNGVTGIATGSSFTYSEVGNVGLNVNAIYDSTFSSVDQPADCTADFSNTLVSGKYGCRIGSVAVAQTTGSSGFGRFIPDHFDTAVVLSSGVPMSCATIGLTCPALYNGFVYAGQAFTTQLTARNLAGLPTSNYNSTTGYSKVVTLAAWDAPGNSAATLPVPGVQNPGPGTLANSSVAANAFSNGMANQATTSYIFITVPTAPTDIYLRAQDTDGVSSLRATVASSVEGGVKVLNGRVRISNAYGSELLPLALTASAQYYDGSSWSSSASDSTTSLTFASSYAVGVSGGTTAVTLVPVSGVLTSGLLTINLSKPTIGAGKAVISPTIWPLYLPITSGTATFGIYKTNNNFIYQRESY